MENVVYTKEDLKEKTQQNLNSMIIKGELANYLHRMKNIGQLNKSSIAAIIAVIGIDNFSHPIEGGISYGVAIPVAIISGLETKMIIWASTIGIDFILTIFQQYKETEYSQGQLILTKK